MKIPYGKQNVSEEDIAAVSRVLRSDFITQGPAVDEFEEAVANYVGAEHGVAANSGTACLYMAAQALGLKEGRLLWTSPNSFVASANCGLHCGADVDFVDIDPDTYNMCVEKLEEKLKASERKPDIVVPVHIAGQSCDMKGIKKLADEYGFKIIEDASHCIGGEYNGKKIGNCEYSDIAVFSFHPVKIITTGEGGMCMTNNAELAEKMEKLRHHGIERGTNPDEPWVYEHQILSYNYRITDFACALGTSQMKRVGEFVAKRRALAKRYDELLADIDVNKPYQLESANSSWHLYIILLENEKRRREVFHKMRAADIGVNVHYVPIHTQPFYQTLGFKEGDFPIAEDYYKRCLSIPLYPDLTEEEQDFVIKTLKESL